MHLVYCLHRINTIDVNNLRSVVIAKCSGNNWEIMSFEYSLSLLFGIISLIAGLCYLIFHDVYV